METLTVMLACGSGASTGFMAANMKKAAKDMGLDVDIIARSESEISEYLNQIDVLMIGPHLEYLFDDIDSYIGDADIGVVLMKPDYYSTLDGKAALEQMLEVFDEDDES
ncbi:PTS sugar transporter subunit IIB [Rothia koreensis]|uniref:PTS sugar transporter subunit IIB n=1 Tax=Rothia koreensis TaxID=592378 RepID=UPI003F276433